MEVMNEKNKKKKAKRKQNNRGSAIVLVIVVLSLMGILVSLILYMCLANYQMKANDLQSKDNFYSAEQILDEIRAGLQSEASAATDVAYMNVIQNYEVHSMDPDARKNEFTFMYVDKMRKALMDDVHYPGDDQRYNIGKLKSFVQDQSILKTSIQNDWGAQIDVLDIDADGTVDNYMIAYSNALVLKNLSVKYKDAKGYVSIITTDIRIAVPNVSFESSLKIPEIIDYSLIANDRLVANSNTTISGSVYGGRDGIIAEGGKGFYFKDSELVITPESVTVSNASSKIVVDQDTSLWAGGTVVDDGASLSLLGNSYIKDDTTVLGNGSKLNIAGKYMGLGIPELGKNKDYTKSYAEEGSSIIINGTKSKVDMSTVNRLLLPGNAYIGVNDAKDKIKPSTSPTGTVTPTVTPAGGPVIATNGDVGLGESLTAKASQLAYLVPAECIGYIKKDASSDYECVLGTNPVLYTKYASAYESASAVDKVEVDYSRAGINYASKYGATFRKKYVRTSNGAATSDTLIYYYMTFNSQEAAANFFYEYFSENKEHISQYLDIYVDSLKVGDVERLNVAGNILKKVPKKDESGNQVYDDAGKEVYTYELVQETKSADNAAGIDYSEEISIYNTVFKGLTTKLVRDGANLKQEELENVDKSIPNSKGIFANLINMEMFNKLCSSTEFNNAGNRAEFVNTVEGVKAIVVNNSTPYVIDSSFPTETSLLIAKGDVEVKIPFKGCIISGGTITVTCGSGADGVNTDIDNDKEMIRHVLNMETEFTIDKENTGTMEKTKVCVMDLFIDGMGIATSESSSDKEDHIVIEDLVTYDNWNKE